MKKDRIVLDFIKKPVAQKIEFGKGVIAKMKDNPTFATPDVILDNLETKNELLETRSIAALSGGKEATALMHQTQDEWDEMMRKMAKYVDRIADGNETIILNAGFNLAKQPSPAVRPDFSVELGEKSGSVTIRRQAVEGAKSYIWQHCMGEIPSAHDADWATAQVTSKASVDLTGLSPLTKYWFRSSAVTTAGTNSQTSPVMQVVI
ncbi:MAG: hypothetical protein GZ091_18750 [Paludibacter sp.]|nr:hypothetical protein [Paludibacter sp.]